MTLPTSFDKREMEVFKETPSGKVAKRVCVDSDTPVPVEIVEGIGDNRINKFDNVVSVASATSTTIVTYTVPAGKKFSLELVEVSGTNVADYTVEIDSAIEAKKRTWWTEFNTEFEFKKFVVAATKVINIKVIHDRSEVGDFDARILGLLEDV